MLFFCTTFDHHCTAFRQPQDSYKLHVDSMLIKQVTYDEALIDYWQVKTNK